MRINEIFHSFQGEGRNTGVSSLFVRLQGCNLNCVWCDTPTSLDYINGTNFTVDELVKKTIIAPPTKYNNLVISGGEPFVQQDEVNEFCRYVRTTIEIETNGTIEPKEMNRSIQYNVSPKIGHSGNKVNTYKPAILKIFNAYNADFKFVVNFEADEPLREIYEIQEDIMIPDSNIWLMPLGTSKEEVEAGTKDLMRLNHPFNVSTRLHILTGVK